MTRGFSSLKMAEGYVRASLLERGQSIQKTERVIVDHTKSGRPIHHSRLLTGNSMYHLKYQRKEHVPLPDHAIRTAHDVNERLKQAIRLFGHGNETDIGINDNVLFELLRMEEDRAVSTFLLNAVGNSIVYGASSVVYWCRAREFYDLAMAWGTVIYNSSAYGGTVFLVPTGWMKLWSNPKTAPPKVVMRQE